jgi:preprotein translocase subunit SecG
MTAIITIIHIIVCMILIVAVLLQSGKSADLAGAFGGGGSQSVFGPRGGQTLLSKLTTICAVLFMFTSLGLWMLSSRQTGSVLKGEPATVTEKAAATPEKKAADETAAVPEKKAPAGDETQAEGTPPPAKKKTVPEKK